MQTILLTGATDGIGLETAKLFAKEDTTLLIHGRSTDKLQDVKEQLLKLNDKLSITCYCADLSKLEEVHEMADAILKAHTSIDVLINNAGVFVLPHDQVRTVDGLDARFAVNTIAPYILTMKLMPILSEGARVVNVASAAQAPVSIEALIGKAPLDASNAYAQSKLAIIMWSMTLAAQYGERLNVISVNPKSFLGSKMVKEAYGRAGYDLSIGADILYAAATSDTFKAASGQYYDNDYNCFAEPHPFAMNASNREALHTQLDTFL